MKFAPSRTGMTLMEIMMSVMILGLGLLGILSVIPFIEYHSARVVESDFTAAAGTNALAVIQSKQWEKPANWVYPNVGEGNPKDYRLPRLFDIFGEGNIELIGKSGALYILQQVHPNTDESLDICRCHDDIVVERDENSSARPQLLTETANKPEFTGAYSWAALMTPITSDPAQSYTDFVFPGDKGVVDDVIPRAEVVMKIDVLAFRGRDATDSRDCFGGQVTGIDSGYLGGSVVITSTDKPTDFEESLSSSTHILLIGPSDQQFQNFLSHPETDNNAPFFSEWYKISNFSRIGNEFGVTLSGPSFPACWSDNPDIGWSPDICVVLFRNLRGVFSKTIPISERE